MNDELHSQKAAAEERSKNQIVELEKAATWVRDLESQLVSSSGALLCGRVLADEAK